MEIHSFQKLSSFPIHHLSWIKQILNFHGTAYFLTQIHSP